MQAGAHPSFLDLWGFGRRPIHGERPADIEKAVLYQVGALLALAQDAGCPVRHVKTHGAMGNMANEDADLAVAVARAIRTLDRDLIFVVMPGLETERAGERLGLPIAREIYADRAYADDGTLVSRKLPGAVLHEPDAVAERVVRMLEDGAITSLSGRRIPTRIDTICVHGDTPGAVAMACRPAGRLRREGLSPCARWPRCSVSEPGYRLLDCGDRALTVELGRSVDPVVNAQVVALDGAIRGNRTTRPLGDGADLSLAPRSLRP